MTDRFALSYAKYAEIGLLKSALRGDAGRAPFRKPSFREREISIVTSPRATSTSAGRLKRMDGRSGRAWRMLKHYPRGIVEALRKYGIIP